MAEIVADAMLMKLGRWLRLCGVKVTDAPRGSDDKIIAYVKRRKALLLTMDEPLAGRARKRNFDVLLVEGKDLDHQLAFVLGTLRIKMPKEPALLCPICDGALMRVDRGDIEKEVPEIAFERHRLFYKCTGCGKVYWRGTHWRAIRRRIKRVKSLAAKVRRGSRQRPRPR